MMSRPWVCPVHGLQGTAKNFDVTYVQISEGVVERRCSVCGSVLTHRPDFGPARQAEGGV